MRMISRRAFLTLTTLLFAARSRRTRMRTWNTFLKLPNVKTCVIILKSVFSQPGVSLSSGTSSRRVPYGRILIVYDPCVNSLSTRLAVHEQVSWIILLLFSMDTKVLGSDQATCLLQDISPALNSC